MPRSKMSVMTLSTCLLASASTGQTQKAPDRDFWTGPWIGASAGIDAADLDLWAEQSGYYTNRTNYAYEWLETAFVEGGGISGPTYGIGAGFDYAFPSRVVLGLAADYTRGDMNADVMVRSVGTTGSCYYDPFTGTNHCGRSTSEKTGNIRISVKQSWSVVGRLGYLTSPQTLLYGLAGRAGSTLEATRDHIRSFPNYSDDAIDPGGRSKTFTNTGWVAGLGVETVLSDNWTLKMEFRRTRYQSLDILGAFNADYLFDEDTDVGNLARAVSSARLQLAYRF